MLTPKLGFPVLAFARVKHPHAALCVLIFIGLLQATVSLTCAGNEKKDVTRRFLQSVDASLFSCKGVRLSSFLFWGDFFWFRGSAERVSESFWYSLVSTV